MKPSRKLQKEMTPREGVSSDEIKLLMCGLINAGRGANARYNHTFILIHRKARKIQTYALTCVVSAQLKFPEWPGGSSMTLPLSVLISLLRCKCYWAKSARNTYGIGVVKLCHVTTVKNFLSLNLLVCWSCVGYIRQLNVLPPVSGGLWCTDSAAGLSWERLQPSWPHWDGWIRKGIDGFWNPK